MVCGSNNNDACTALKLYREVENEKGCINYGRLEENHIYDENKKHWELGRNRMIEKVINAIKYGEDYMKY